MFGTPLVASEPTAGAPLMAEGQREDQQGVYSRPDGPSWHHELWPPECGILPLVHQGEGSLQGPVAVPTIFG